MNRYVLFVLALVVCVAVVAGCGVETVVPSYQLFEDFTIVQESPPEGLIWEEVPLGTPDPLTGWNGYFLERNAEGGIGSYYLGGSVGEFFFNHVRYEATPDGLCFTRDDQKHCLNAFVVKIVIETETGSEVFWLRNNQGRWEVAHQ